jgi:hypothetical protein
MEGYEADDVLGSTAGCGQRRLRCKNRYRDKELLQLVTDKIWWNYPEINFLKQKNRRACGKRIFGNFTGKSR